MRQKGFLRYQIELFDEQNDFKLDNHKFIKLALFTLKHENIPETAEMSINFVDQKKMAQLNWRWRKIKKPTDVLSFPIDDPREYKGRNPDNSFPSPTRDFEQEDPPILLGDIFIAPSVAFTNAQEKNISFKEEMYLLTVHGILHLLGFDHEKKVDEEIMVSHEQIILSKFNKLENIGI